MQGVDAVFFALPHGQSQKIMPQVVEAGAFCVVDLAADFRLQDPEVFAQHYGEHSSAHLIDRFVYGLPEAYADQIAQSRLIANPGCFATAAQLLLLPLAARKVLPDAAAVFAVTGSSGSGIHPKPGTHHPFRDGNLYAYKALAHQHEPEINQALSAVAGKPCTLRLLAHSGPFVRGIHATAYLNDPQLSGLDVAKVYEDYYDARHPFVTVLAQPPQVAEVTATNFAHVHVAQKGGEVQIALALDNLVKGAAGQAIQNMNLSLGLDQTRGLTHPGAFPC